MNNPIVKVGDKVWIWHFDSLIHSTVEEVTEISNTPAVLYKTSFCTTDFYENREDAIEARVRYFCQKISWAVDKKASREEMLALKELADSTLSALTNQEESNTHDNLNQ